MQLFKPRGTGWGWRVGSVTMLPRRAAPVSARSAAERSSTVHRGGSPNQGNHGGNQESHQDPAAHATAADKTWAGPGAMVAKPPPYTKEDLREH